MATHGAAAAKRTYSLSHLSTKDALQGGNWITKLSFLISGFGNLVYGQIAKGLAFLALELAYVYYMIIFGVSSIGDFITLGTQEQAEVYNEALGIFEYVAGDNSMLCLLYGVVTIFITLGLLLLLAASGRSAFGLQLRKEAGSPLPTLRQDLASLKQDNLHKMMLFLPVMGILIFTIIPLVYMILIAFTSYDSTHQPPGKLFDWVGLANFSAMFAQGGKLANTFWPVLGWTLLHPRRHPGPAHQPRGHQAQGDVAVLLHPLHRPAAVCHAAEYADHFQHQWPGQHHSAEPGHSGPHRGGTLLHRPHHRQNYHHLHQRLDRRAVYHAVHHRYFAEHPQGAV